MTNFSSAYHSSAQRMILNRLRYDRERYSIANEYIENRKRSIYRAKLASMTRLDDAHRLAQQRGEFMLEMVRRDIDADLDAIMFTDMMALNDQVINDLLEGFPVEASKAMDGVSPFPESAEFLKTFSDYI